MNKKASFMKSIAGRLETTTSSIEYLLQDVERGEVKVPMFQRKFVWTEQQALELLDSIAHNYPIGSILLWQTRDKISSQREIGDFKLPQTDDMSPTSYILDGQQRLTTLYAYLKGTVSANPPLVPAGYDLEGKKFVANVDARKENSLVFPMNYIFNVSKMFRFMSSLADSAQNDLSELVKVFTNYRIPVVVLKDLTVEEVCPIFERINSSGTRLSVYDLMVAATWSPRFDLNKQTESISEQLRKKNFDDVDGDTILKCLSAVKSRNVSKEAILSLRHTKDLEMNTLVENTTNSLLRAIDILSTEFKVSSMKILPYEALIVILTSALNTHKSLTPDQLKKLKMWFWQSSFTERYRGAPDSVISKDIDKFTEYLRNETTPSSNDFGGSLDENDIMKTVFRTNNARTRAFILLLAARNPMNITNGSTIDLSLALSEDNRKQFHHVYPNAYLKNLGVAADKSNSIVNICMLAALDNKKISANDPNKYIPELISGLGTNADVVFGSNFLPLPSSTDYTVLGYSPFIEQRAEILKQAIEKLCAGESV